MQKPNIVLVTLDCCRLDDFGCNGSTQTDTPTIDSVASEGLVCEEMQSQSTITWCSHASILTGMNPPATQAAILDGRLDPERRDAFSPISPDVPLTSEILTRHGYVCGGFVGHKSIGSVLGFNRGFQHFNEDCSGAVWWEREKLARAFGHWVPDQLGAFWPDELDDARRFMGENKERPFFVWIHYFDTHDMTSPALPQYYKDNYDRTFDFHRGKVSYADQVCVKPLVEHLKTIRKYDDTILIITSDHGEALGEWGRWGHATEVWNTMAQVPCVIRYPVRLEPQRVRRLTRSIDIVPTALSLIDEGQLLDAMNPTLEGKPITHLDSSGDHVEAYCETIDVGTHERKSALRLDDGSEKWRYHVEKNALFDLVKDPGEQENVAHVFPGKANSLLRKAQWYQAKRYSAHAPRSAREMSEDEKKVVGSLRALGYL